MMEPSIVLHELRTRGQYPALVADSLRLYGDTSKLTPGLRQAITDHRADIITLLRQPEQSIAYDLLDIANEAGWHPTVTGDTLIWRCGDLESPNPMPNPSLCDALDHHVAAVIRVLVDVPDGCRNRARCERQGICVGEIRESACFMPTTRRTAQEERSPCPSHR